MSKPTVKLTVKTRSQSRLEENRTGSREEATEELSSEEGSQCDQTPEFLDTSALSLPEVEDPEAAVSSEEEEVQVEEQAEAREMAEARAPVINPTKFRGTFEDNVEEYLTKFERAARANGWDDARKVVLIPCYLEGAALKWFENLEQVQGENLTWAIIKTGMKEAFQTIAWEEQLEYRLRMRMQGEEEPVEAYFQDVINLCTKIDPTMSERSKIKHVLRGLRPSLLEKVMVMDNGSLENLQSNIRKVQTARFMAGQRVDHIMADPVGGTGVSGPITERVTATNSSASLESKIEQLASEFSKLNMRLLEQRPTEQGSSGETVGARRFAPPRRGDDRRGRGSFRGAPRGRTSDGRVICYKCNRVGHFAVACRSNENQGNDREGC